MRAIYKILLEKAIVAMKSAVGVYNNPSLSFKSEIYIVNAIIAWTYLLHSFYRKENIDYHYYKRTQTGRKRYEKVDGRNKTWDLSKCLTHEKCPLNSAQKNNIRLLIKIRNSIEHTAIYKIDNEISSYIFASSINFNNILKKVFHEKYALDKELGMAIQFSELNPFQKKQLKTKQKSKLSNIIAEFQLGLTDKDMNDNEYSYKVAFVPLVVNRPNQAHSAITFHKTNDPETELLNTYIKETEKPKFKPKEIVMLMNKKGYTHFTMHKHTMLWKENDARRVGLGYGIMISGSWYWYMKWVEFVEEHLKKENENND